LTAFPLRRHARLRANEHPSSEREKEGRFLFQDKEEEEREKERGTVPTGRVQQKEKKNNLV